MSEGPFDIDNLDEMSREAANGHTLPFKESSWKKMELLLDEDKKRRFVFWWWLLPALLILGLSGVYFITKKTNNKIVESRDNTAKSNTDKSLAPFNPVNPTKQNQLKTSEKNNDGTANPIAEKQPTSTFAGAKHTTVATDQPPVTNNNKKSNPFVYSTTKKANSVIARQQKKVNNSTSTGLNPTATTFRNQGMPIILSTVSPNKKQSGNGVTNLFTEKENVSLGNNKQALGNGNAKNNNVAGQNVNKDQLDSSTKKLVEQTIAKSNIDSVQKNSVNKTIDTTANTAKKSDKQSTKKLSRFDFSALVEADLSMVKFKKIDKLSNGFGIGVSYKLSKRWGIGTGIAYTTKLYKADSTDYKKAVFNAWNLTVLNIDANCKVIEIPLNVQYLISEKKKSSWFATAGLSSYFMNKEDYNYTILKNGMIKNMSYTYINEYHHIISILTLQADYQRKINEQFSWQLSPFIKLPLTGIGEGSVSLESVGLQFSLHYRPKKK